MGIKSEKVVEESTSSRASKHKGYSNMKNIEHNTNFMQMSIDANNSSDTQQHNDPRLLNLNLGTFHSNKDHPRNANTHNMNNNTDLVIFQANLLILNFNKTNYIQFMAKPKPAVDLQIRYKDNLINNTYSTNFLGLTLNSTLSWKTHIDQLF